jgi:heavy-metal resistance protein
MKRNLIAFLLLAGLGTAAMAQVDVLPPGKWWRQERLIQNLGLTQEQQSRLDGIFDAAAEELIDQKAEVEKRAVALRREMEQANPGRQNVQRAAEALNQARGRLFVRELMMFVDMRDVLSEDQWTRFRSFLEARHRARRESRMHQQHRPGAPNKRNPNARPQ